MAQLPTDLPPGHSTGPRTAEGKARSSQNSFKHGSCSNKPLLADEDPRELQSVMDMWTQDYDCSTGPGLILASETATSYWLLLRQRRRYNEAEQFVASQQPDPMHWTVDQHKHLQLFMRYLTAAERTFSRSLATLEAFRSRRVRETQAIQRDAHRAAELQMKRERHGLQKPTVPSAKTPPPLNPHQTLHRTEAPTRPI